MRFPTLF